MFLPSISLSHRYTHTHIYTHTHTHIKLTLKLAVLVKRNETNSGQCLKHWVCMYMCMCVCLFGHHLNINPHNSSLREGDKMRHSYHEPVRTTQACPRPPASIPHSQPSCLSRGRLCIHSHIDINHWGYECKQEILHLNANEKCMAFGNLGAWLNCTCSTSIYFISLRKRKTGRQKKKDEVFV